MEDDYDYDLDKIRDGRVLMESEVAFDPLISS